MNMAALCKWAPVKNDTTKPTDVVKQGLCAWNEPTGTSTAANPCNIYNDEPTCNADTTGECKWELINTGNDSKPEPKPLFSTDFCHPATMPPKDTMEAEWTMCVAATEPITCANTQGCNWSNGKELIPDHDFCAPMDLTNNVDLIKECISADANATCVAGCSWRHGRNNTGDNTRPNNTIPLFTEDFCHPVAVSKNTD